VGEDLALGGDVNKVEPGELKLQLADHEEAFCRLVDYAFWQLMLVDDLGIAEILVEEACYRLKTRLAELLAAYSLQDPAVPEAGVQARVPSHPSGLSPVSEIVGSR
jgi:hypothetical protein